MENFPWAKHSKPLIKQHTTNKHKVKNCREQRGTEALKSRHQNLEKHSFSQILLSLQLGTESFSSMKSFLSINGTWNNVFFIFFDTQQYHLNRITHRILDEQKTSLVKAAVDRLKVKATNNWDSVVTSIVLTGIRR